MQCQRCGFVNLATAVSCANCGFLLPLRTDGVDARFSQQPAAPIDAVWREENGGQPFPTLESGGLPWGRDGNQEAPNPFASRVSNPGRALLPAPRFEAPRDPRMPMGPASGGPGLPDYSGYRGYTGQAQPMGAYGANTVGASAVEPGRELQPQQRGYEGGGVVESASALSQPLGPGALLRGGRYRLIQRFLGPDGPQPQSAEPPLMIASDTETPNTRVLAQELPLHTVRPEDTEHVRRLIAQRVQGLGMAGALPRLLDHFSERRRHFLIFEAPTGESLLDRIQRSKALDETLAITFALQALDALAALAEAQPPIIHGAICPATIFLRPGGQATLVGISPTLLMRADGTVEHGSAGGVLGYAAPEQARGQATERSDTFSLCASLHHAVTGTAPSPRPNPLYQMARRLNPEVSLELEEVLTRGLRPSANQRFQSVAELRAALAPLASGARTRVPDDLRAEENEDAALAALAPVRDARGRLRLRRRRPQNPLVVLGSIVALVAVLGASALFILTPSIHTAHVTPTPTPNDLVGLFQQEGVALSTGEFTFDTQRSDNTLKQQGAQALASGDAQGAQRAFSAAMKADPTDPEAVIYNQNLQALATKAPLVTLVAGVAFGAGGVDETAARSELQGVALAQAQANAFNLLPGGYQVRVLILNTGPKASNVKDGIAILARQAQQGNQQRILGVIGWPESAQTSEALAALRSTGLPLLAPTITDDMLAGSNSNNYFALSPPDTTRIAELADTAARQLNAQRILVLRDPTNARSAAFAAAFSKELTGPDAALGVGVDTAAFSTDITTDFSAQVDSALFNGDDFIYIAGDDRDAAQLAFAMERVNARGTSGATPLRALADSTAFSPALLGLGASATAQFVRRDPGLLSSLLVADLANVQSWSTMNSASLEAASFNSTFTTQFSSTPGPGALADTSGYSILDAGVTLAYDAGRMAIAAGVRGVKKAATGVVYPDPTGMRDELLQFNAATPFIGMSGAIAYDAAGRIAGKAVPLDRFVVGSAHTATAAVANIAIVTVIGGRTLFCGATTNVSNSAYCQPTSPYTASQS